MDDTADNPAVVNTRLATRVRRQVPRDPRELRIGEPETIPIHPRFVPDSVNHTQPAIPTAFWIQALRAK
jgi:hypothetical protein